MRTLILNSSNIVAGTNNSVLEYEFVGGNVNATGVVASPLEATTSVFTNSISERTAASGVTVDGVLLKDGGATLTGDLAANANVTLGDAAADTLTVNAKLATSGIKGATATSYVPIIFDAEAQAITGGGAISVATYYTAVSTAAAEAYSLANGTMVGQLKVIRMNVDLGDATITPATALASGATTITLNDVGDTVELMWNGTNWRVLKNLGATIA